MKQFRTDNYKRSYTNTIQYQYIIEIQRLQETERAITNESQVLMQHDHNKPNRHHS